MNAKVISIGYGRHLFQADNPERLRQEKCAQTTAGLNLIIFTKQEHQLNFQVGENNLKLYPTNSSSKLGMIFDAYRIARHIIKSDDKNNLIVTTQDPFEAGLIGLFLKWRTGVSLNVQEHGDVFSLPFWRQESLLNQVRFYLGKFVLKRADSIRVVSLRIRQTLIGLGIPEVKINNLPVAIDLNNFTQSNNKPVEEFFGADDFVFLTVARFVPQKNLSLMIKAFSKAYSKNSKVRLLLVGDGPAKDKIETLITEHLPDRSLVKIIPWSDNVPGLMASSNAYLLSSNYEGWARVLVEALVSDLPIVTTDVGCAGEVVKNEIHGLVVSVNDEQAFADAMTKIASDKNFYNYCLDNIKAIDKSTIPGVNQNNYGDSWSKTLIRK